jgi:hypothetical protein
MVEPDNFFSVKPFICLYPISRCVTLRRDACTRVYPFTGIALDRLLAALAATSLKALMLGLIHS